MGVFLNLFTGILTNICNVLGEIRNELRNFNLFCLESTKEKITCDNSDLDEILNNMTDDENTDCNEEESKDKKSYTRCNNSILREIILSLDKEFTFSDFLNALIKRGCCDNVNNARKKLRFCVNFNVVVELDNGKYLNLLKDNPDEFTFATMENREKFRQMIKDKIYPVIYRNLPEYFTREDTYKLCLDNNVYEKKFASRLCDFELFGFIKRKNEREFKKLQDF